MFSPNWSGPLTAPPPPGEPARLFKVEAIRPGTPEWYFNIASPECLDCGGMGRVSMTVDGVRCWTPCTCIDPERAA